MKRVAIVLSGLVLVLVWPQWFAVGRAQQPASISVTLMQRAQAQGTVRVIVELDLAAQPDGLLAGNARALQRMAIDTAQNQVLAALDATTFRVMRRFLFIPHMALEVTPQALAALAQSPLVRSVVEDHAEPMHLAQSVPLVQGTNAWTAGYTGSGWAVAVLDTGVDSAHAFLAGRVISEACYSGNGYCPNGLTSQTGPGSGVPCTFAGACFHGTHVAGIAAGEDASFSGVAKGAGVIAIQVFTRFTGASCGTGADPCALAYVSDQISGLERVYALRSTFNIASVNMSLGGGQYFTQAACDASNTARKLAIDNLRSAGIATVASAGNSAYTSAMGAPACISSAISVGSTTKGDVMSSFSNSVGFMSLVAPGSSINSSVPGGSFGFASGTSMASPHVAGAWAIAKQASPSESVTVLLDAFRASNTLITDARNGLSFPRLEIMTALAETSGDPGAFSRTAPGDGAAGQPMNPTLSWSASSGAESYEYCIDTTNDSACSGWTSTGMNTSVGLSGLSPATPHYWHVRAIDGLGMTYANGSASTYWSFTTAAVTRPPLVYLDAGDSGDAVTFDPSTGDWARQLSQPGGGFAWQSQGTWAPGWSVFRADFNADGLTDVFLHNATSGAWFKLLNNGTTFTEESNGAWWPGWQKFVLDLNGDAISDLFLYDPATGQWYRCVSTPTGFTYSSGWWNPGWEIAPMNLNGDAYGDLFLIDRSTGRWFWVVGEAGGGFSYPTVGYWVPDWALYPGDFNGDGLGDVFLYRAAAGEYYVALNNGAGYSYTAGYGWAAGWTPYVGDLDGDGTDDLFLSGADTGQWFEMISDGAGGFSVGGNQAWSSGWQLYPTDLNGDHRTDFLLYNPTTGAWYQARNLVTGSFSYSNGFWAPGLTIVTRAPNP